MANLAASAVTIERSWTEGGTSGKELSARKVTLVLTGQGGATNLIPASVLLFRKIEEASFAVQSDNSRVIPASPSYDGSTLFLTNPAQTTDATRPAPADITGTFRLVVKGISL